MTYNENDHSERPGCWGHFLAAFGLVSRPDKEQLALPYVLRIGILSQGEEAFYLALKTAVGDRAVIWPKVGLGDLFYPKTGDRSANATYRNKIDRKHVDFLLCDPLTLKPLAGIELDDTSHRRADRKKRDQFVDQVFAAAKLPLVHVPAAMSYQVDEIAAKLSPHLGLAAVPSPPEQPPLFASQREIPKAPPPAAPPAPVAPPCPKCGKTMVLRTVKRPGPNYGREFWGCVDYPQCGGVREYRPGE